MKVLNIVGLVAGIIIIFIFGFAFGNLYNLRTSNNNFFQKELAGTWSRNETGDWVCVNVHSMNYSRAVEVCQHEVGHEIFAEICEKDFDKCLGVMEK